MLTINGVGATMLWDFDNGSIQIQRGVSTWNSINNLSTVWVSMEDIRRVEMQLVSTLQMGYIRLVLADTVPHTIPTMDTTLVLFTDGTPLYPAINRLCAQYPNIKVTVRSAGQASPNTTPYTASKTGYRTPGSTPPPAQPVYTPPPVPPSAAAVPPRPPASVASAAKPPKNGKWKNDQNLANFYLFSGSLLTLAAGCAGIGSMVWCALLLAPAAALLVGSLRLHNRVRDYKALEYARGGQKQLSFQELADRLNTPVEDIQKTLLSFQALSYFPGDRVDLSSHTWQLPESYIPTVAPLKDSHRLKSTAVAWNIWGLLFVAAGAALSLPMLPAALFGISSLTSLVLRVLGSAGLGCGMIFQGVRLQRLNRRYTAYRAMLGSRRSVSLEELADAAHCSVKRVEKDLQALFFRGFFPGSTLAFEQKYFLLPGGEAPELKSPEEDAAAQAADHVAAQIQLIRDVNSRIPDPTLTAKIDHMEQITVQILAVVEKYPEKQPQARRFLNYYFPTTLKLLNSYADFDQQEVKTESVQKSMHNIERMLDTLLEAYEKQLDYLFSTQTMDISSEIQVMETMLQRDGLSDTETAMLHPS